MDLKFNQTDKYVFLLFFLFAIPIFLIDDNLDCGWKFCLTSLLIYIVLNSLSIYVLVFVLFRYYFPKKRYIELFIAGTAFIVFIGFVSILIDPFAPPVTYDTIFTSFMYRIEEIGILTTIFLGKKLFDAQLHFVEMEKEKKAGELQLLKSQIDPHFLFNNLNTVDALIDSDPKRAKVYLNKLAQLYRYLISNKDNEVIFLEDELEFAKNYIYLIQQRYGSAFEFEIHDTRLDQMTKFIPPGALQTLLENIVKHNQASESRPIKTEIKIEDSHVFVTNNQIRKNLKVDSTGIGLSNLKSRYKLLTDQVIDIVSGSDFKVILPLIKQVA